MLGFGGGCGGPEEPSSVNVRSERVGLSGVGGVCSMRGLSLGAAVLTLDR